GSADSPLRERPHLRHALPARPLFPRRAWGGGCRSPGSAGPAPRILRASPGGSGGAGGGGGRNTHRRLLDRPMLPQRREIANLVVCEDDARTLELLCDNLVADRFGVLPAPSASDALRLCRYNHPDLLLLDLS